MNRENSLVDELKGSAKEVLVAGDAVKPRQALQATREGIRSRGKKDMKAKMQAAVFEGVGKLVVKEVDTPKIVNGDDVICEVEVCSVCGTDVHIMEVPPGYIATPGTILGHELVGRVVSVGTDVKR